MRFIGVEVEQETSAPLLKSAPEFRQLHRLGGSLLLNLMYFWYEATL